MRISLIVVGETITDTYLTNVILNGLLEEFNHFIMMIFGKSDPPSLSEIESLLLVQESHLDKYHQELAVTTVDANIAQETTPNAAQGYAINGHNFGNQFGRGRGRQGRNRGRGRARRTGPRPTCQLYGRYGHSVFVCWFCFDETFVPPAAVTQTTAPADQQQTTTGTEAATTSTTPQVNLAEAMSLDAIGIPSDSPSNCSEEEDWYGDTGATHHVTPNSKFTHQYTIQWLYTS